MSFEYYGPHSPKTVEQLDRFFNPLFHRLEAALSRGKEIVEVKVKAGLRTIDSYKTFVEQSFTEVVQSHSSIVNFFKEAKALESEALTLVKEPLSNFLSYQSLKFFYRLSDSLPKPPPPKPITDYEKAKQKGDKLALFLANLIEPFKENRDLHQLEGILRELYANRREEFKSLLERFTVPDSDARYARHLVLSDTKLGIDIYAYVWLPHQYSDPHRHNASDAVGIVLQGRNVRQRTWKADGTVVNEDLNEGDVGFVSKDDTHQVFNNDNQIPLITFEIFSPGLNAESLAKEEVAENLKINRSTDAIFSSLATFNYLTY